MRSRPCACHLEDCGGWPCGWWYSQQVRGAFLLYGVRSARKLYDIKILSTDGYWESDNIFVSKVVYQQSGSGLLGATSSQKYWLIQALIESGFSESEAKAQMNILEMAGDFSNLMNDISSPFLSQFLVNITDEPMTLTEYIKFGRGSEGWIPVVE